MIFSMHKYSGSNTNAGFAKTSPNLSKYPCDQSAVNFGLLQCRWECAESWGKKMAARILNVGSHIPFCSPTALCCSLHLT